MTKKVTDRVDPSAQKTVDKWVAKPDASGSARLGSRILAGEWTSSADAEEMGMSHSIVSQVVNMVRSAGYTLEEKKGAYGMTSYRVKGSRRRQPLAPIGIMGPERPSKAQVHAQAQTRAPIYSETNGVTHPALGAKLIVRALALTDDGLRMQLSDGNGRAWWASVSGHVE